MNRINGVDARTWLLVPGDRPDQFSAPENREADALVLDLAGSVAPANKEIARRAVTEHLSGEGTAWVRVNRSDTELCGDDLRAIATAPGLQGVVLPRTESAEQVGAVRAQLRAGVMIVAVVQTAAGIENADNIAGAPSTLRLAFGTGLEWELGITGGAAALLYARSRLVMASYAAELPGPIDGASPDLDDIVALGEDLRHAVGLGFTGKACLHPQQPRMTNSAFAPASSKLAWARRVLTATRASPTSVAHVDGEMVDWQHIDAARQIVARAALFDPAEAGFRKPVVRRLRGAPRARPTWRLDC